MRYMIQAWDLESRNLVGEFDPTDTALVAYDLDRGEAVSEMIPLSVLSPLLDVHSDEDGRWSVGIRAMPGMVGAADTLEDAIAAAANAAEAWIEAWINHFRGAQ